MGIFDKIKQKVGNIQNDLQNEIKGIVDDFKEDRKDKIEKSIEELDELRKSRHQMNYEIYTLDTKNYNNVDFSTNKNKLYALLRDQSMDRKNKFILLTKIYANLSNEKCKSLIETSELINDKYAEGILTAMDESDVVNGFFTSFFTAVAHMWDIQQSDYYYQKLIGLLYNAFVRYDGEDTLFDNDYANDPNALIYNTQLESTMYREEIIELVHLDYVLFKEKNEEKRHNVLYDEEGNINFYPVAKELFEQLSLSNNSKEMHM